MRIFGTNSQPSEMVLNVHITIYIGRPNVDRSRDRGINSLKLGKNKNNNIGKMRKG